MRIPPPYRRVLTWFAALQLTVGVGGLGWEVHQLGWSDREAIARVGAGVKTSFAAIVAALDATTSDIAARRDLISRAATDLTASRELFAALASRVDADAAVTVYSAQDTPLAWAGRPSDLGWLRARVIGPAAVFVAPGPSGTRIVKVQPITEQTAGATTRRIGTIVSERDLPSAAAAGPTTDALLWPSALVPVHLRTRYEGAGESRHPNAFLLAATSGEPLLEGTVLATDVASARTRLRRTTGAAAIGLCALLCGWLALPLMARSARRRSGMVAATCVIGAVCAIVGARVLARVAASLAAITPTLDVTGIVAGAITPYLATPVDLLATALAVLAMAAIAGEAVTRLRIASRRHRRVVQPGTASFALFVASQCAAATAVTTLLAKYDAALHALAEVPGLDLLSFSVHPWEPRRLALSVAILGLHAAVVWGAVTLLRFGLLWFNPGKTLPVRAAWTLCWLGPLAIWVVATRLTPTDTPGWTIVPPALLAIVLAWGSVRFAHWRRRASQSASMSALFLALALPSYAFYPAAFVHATSANHSVVETQLAPQVMRQRAELQVRVRSAWNQIDRVPGLAELAATQAPPRTASPPTESAFLVWSQTDLGIYRLTSAVELYSADGTLVSRFALNLPEYTSTQEKWQEASCGWDMVEEVSPFGSEERRLLHAGRALCADGPTGRHMVGAIVIHAMLDYAALPFLSSQNPYVELFRTGRSAGPDKTHARETEFAVYGWSRRPLFESASGASSLDDETFRRVYASRTPFWTKQVSAGRSYDVYLSNDRGGIYALRLPSLDALGHLVVLAELATLAGVVYVLWLLLGAFASALGLSAADRGRDLFNEIRASFYRKLALAVVAAAVVPVLFLAALAQNYMSGQLRAGIEEAAIRTATVAQRVVEDYDRLQERTDSPGQPLTDDIMVWIARVIDQDVNVYDGALLAATSERDLFASGLLPTRTSANVFRAIALDRRATFVGEERAGSFSYLVAAAPARLSGHDAILTVPLTLRQQAIEREIDDLNRRILLAVVFFVLLGSGLGWWMAERIADPVRALQRATRKLSQGDLDVRLVMTSSNELSRLVDAFNAMAVDLKRHQASAERTHKLEAWADMARQVAHEIKNPLTPIQLSAEHLRRVHQDRGSPLGPVLENCIDSILTQVRMLRQIAGDFSSFASSPTPRPVQITPADLVAEVIAPYRTGLPSGIHLSVDVPPTLPAISVDRSLVGRALANVVENALHAMPGGGSLTISARLSTDLHRLEFSVRDTGVGMERSALGRIFEPYFSTKAIGTGLGLTIVKRNVELHGGTVVVDSEPGVGTLVTLSLPVVDRPSPEESVDGRNP
ncbi:MAG: HAMP domain-containing sensor histidine kinase [Acidobacteria bacterium]|nr:HAMP domain-containing sensor histidine kinase [Acidobacteriota bacterium]